MRVVISGGAGFLGQCLARAVARRGALRAHARDGGEASVRVREIVLADVARPQMLFDELRDDAAIPTRVAVGDVADAAFVDALVAGADGVSIFHLGAIMSGQGEARRRRGIFRGDASRRGRGWDADIPWRRVAATPRLGRG